MRLCDYDVHHVHRIKNSNPYGIAHQGFIQEFTGILQIANLNINSQRQDRNSRGDRSTIPAVGIVSTRNFEYLKFNQLNGKILCIQLFQKLNGVEAKLQH